MPAVAYLTAAQFVALSVVPAEAVAEVEANAPGWTEAQLLSYSAQIDARLAKRYSTPFQDAPAVVQNWLQRLVTPRVLYKRGVDPADAQVDALIKDADQVWAEIKESADATNGLFDLPLRSDNDASGVTKNKVRFRADVSPYEGMDRQACLYARGRR